mgnify:CR=1 FL=1
MASMGLKTDAAELEDACRQALRTMRRDHKIPCPFSPIGQRALVVGGRLPEMVACLDNVICRGSGFNSWAAFKSHVHNAAKADEECHMTLWRCMEDGDARRFDGHEVSDPIMLWIDFSDEAKEQEYNSSRLLAEKYASFFPSECLPVFHRDGFARRALLVWRTDNSISALVSIIFSASTSACVLQDSFPTLPHNVGSQGTTRMPWGRPKGLMALTGAVAQPHDVTSRMVFKLLQESQHPTPSSMA